MFYIVEVNVNKLGVGFTQLDAMATCWWLAVLLLALQTAISPSKTLAFKCCAKGAITQTAAFDSTTHTLECM